jgi:hypothetical protein
MSNTRRLVLLAGGLLTSGAVGGISTVSQLASTQSVNAQSNEPSADFDYQLAYQRGIEAVLWWMPDMSDVFFRESLFKNYGMKPGDVLVMSRPLVARHEVPYRKQSGQLRGYGLRPRDGPFVVEIPASSNESAIIGEICDNWQAPVVEAWVLSVSMPVKEANIC